MSSRAVRDITKASPSRVSSSPARPPIKVDLETRRTSRMVAKTSNVPKTSGATRHPKEFIPNSCSPSAINHLPTGGCTANEAVLCITSGVPATTFALASGGQLRS
jgi:hypothetical protein